mmetsp:Transcript_91597/g.261806  ORF Transcript_91597/g.261806 Transcript_91597/m.261806 type:complete len:522 (-) Transcript_91597:468-2033(-)
MRCWALHLIRWVPLHWLYSYSAHGARSCWTLYAQEPPYHHDHDHDHDHNHDHDHHHGRYTLNEKITSAAAATLAIAEPTHPLPKGRLADLKALHDGCTFDEAKLAVEAFVDTVAQAGLRTYLSHQCEACGEFGAAHRYKKMERYCNRDCEMKHKNTGKKWRKKSDVTNPLLAGALSHKLTHLYAQQQAQFAKVPLLTQMKHGSAKCLEDRLALWLEGQGIQHWTPEVAEAAAGAGEGAAVDTAAAEAVYYLTEDDVGEQQERENGSRRHTPDFVFVDANREVVQVPLQIKATPKKAELDRTALFYASVLEVKGHICLPGLGSEDDEDKIGLQLSRYTEHFGPTMMLQKRAMAISTSMNIYRKAPTAGIVSFDPGYLPETNRVVNPFNDGATEADATLTQAQSRLLAPGGKWSAVDGPRCNKAAGERAALAALREDIRRILGKEFGADSNEPVYNLCSSVFAGWECRLIRKQEAVALADLQRKNDEIKAAAIITRAIRKAGELRQAAFDGEEVDDWETLADF